MPAVSIERDGFTAQGLQNEVGDHTSILRVHVGAVGVEDANQPHIDAEGSPIFQRHRFGRTLALVIATSDAEGVHVAPVGFRLGMDQGIAIDLTCGGVQDAGSAPVGKLQHTPHPLQRCGEREEGVALIMGRRGRASEAEHPIVGTFDGGTNVGLQQGDAVQACEIFPAPRIEIVQDCDGVAECQEPPCEIGADEPRAARNENPRHGPLV